jgi:hypothetical protein
LKFRWSTLPGFGQIRRAHGWWHGSEMPGTNLPGVLTAGTFDQA